MSKNSFMMLRKLHGKLHESRLRKALKRKLHQQYIEPYLEKSQKTKCVFLVLTPQHTNLGDHAIAFSEVELLRKYGVDYVEITGDQLLELQQNRLFGMLNSYPIIINGGGNLGTLWFGVEQMMRGIIKNNPKSEIFIMPNTFYYEDSEWGREELKKSIRLYNSHKRLHIYAREKISFDNMYPIYNDVKLIPDMVLSQYKCTNDSVRNGCLLCMRDDREKTISDTEKDILIKSLSLAFGSDIKYTDTHSLEPVSPDQREKALEQKYAEFRNAKLVITDRLHGMIFCAITGTPCVVLNSQSPKVLGCYHWLQHLNYIKFCDDISQLSGIVESLSNVECKYDNSVFSNYYEKLGNDILKHI